MKLPGLRSPFSGDDFIAMITADGQLLRQTFLVALANYRPEARAVKSNTTVIVMAKQDGLARIFFKKYQINFNCSN